ncbi:hypothetical protein [Sphingomonas zeicaulis]|uniref:hypothetical protein n=1 Tax=Sphingomonas zeicaulis TaxID=1632740 RepID=UPI003D1DD777
MINDALHPHPGRALLSQAVSHRPERNPGGAMRMLPRLETVKHGRRWCDICVEDADAEDIVRDLLVRLRIDAGYQADIFREGEARRIMEVTDHARIVGTTCTGTPDTAADEAS